MTIFEAFLALSLLAGAAAAFLLLWPDEPEDLGKVSPGYLRRLKEQP